MKYIKNFEELNKINENYEEILLKIKNEYSDIKMFIDKDGIDLGEVGSTSPITIKNLQQTFKDGIVKIIDGRYRMIIKDK